MAAKKTSATPKNGHTNGHGDARHVDDEGNLCLAGELFWKYRALDAEYRNAVLAQMNKNLEMVEELKKHPELMKIVAEKDALGESAKRQAIALSELMETIGKVLGTDLAQCSIDDKSGRIFIHENGEMVPLKATKKPKSAKSCA